ncbi:MAG: hypothetical protein FJ186_01445 [Gammaproteobacteria bacterium]|nr:hypothetical protein [Gammaproteobacteria bacterium]
MKYTSVIAAAAVLSASTYALDAKFGLGVEASNFALEGKRNVGTVATPAAAIAAGTQAENYNTLANTVAGSKQILGLKASATMKMSDRFSLEAGLVINSGKLETTIGRNAILTGAAGTAVTAYKELINTAIKPTYGFGVKAMFGFNDSFKIGPEIRIQRLETTHSGAIQSVALTADGAVANDAALTTANVDNDAASAVANAIKTDKVSTTETSFGVALSGMLNEKIAVNAGYLTVKAKQHVVTLTSNTAGLEITALGQTAAGATFNLESEKPSLDQYYVGLSMSF